MSIILDISWKLREKSEKALSDKAWDLGEALATPSFAVEKVLTTKPTDFVVLKPDELEQYVFDELFHRTREGREVTPEYILSLQYIAKNIANISQSDQSSYIIDAIEQWDYKRAGDNAVFGYIHFVWKRKNPLTKEDYVHLAEQCYLRWYDKNRNSIGFIVASHVEWILTRIEDWSTDMMRRAPAFSVIAGRV
jgi:hypothetical protein